MHDDTRQPEHVGVYLRLRSVFGDGASRSMAARKKKLKPSRSVPFSEGRDPFGIGEAIDTLTVRLGWTSSLAKSELLLSWPAIVGAETAGHTQPISIEEGVLAVRCDSTAWATQLRLMRTRITTEIANRFPDAGIQSVRFDGPNAPTWKRGPRSIPGRGPRDTYG